MRRPHWLIPAVIVVVLAMVTSAAAKTGSRSEAAKGTMAAAPFAQSWAQVPATAAGRKAANVVVVGAEQTFNGFNAVLNCCSQLWATFAGGEETGRGAFTQNQKGDWVKELVSDASANKTGVTYTIRPDAYWY